MNKLVLTPAHLRVDSFPTQHLPTDARGTVEARVTGLLHTCPECANTGPYSTCRA
jgi:hypothetical protein